MSDYQIRQINELGDPLRKADIYLNKQYYITLSYDAFRNLIAGKSVAYANVNIKLEGNDYNKLTQAMYDEMKQYTEERKRIRIEK